MLEHERISSFEPSTTRYHYLLLPRLTACFSNQIHNQIVDGEVATQMRTCKGEYGRQHVFYPSIHRRDPREVADLCGRLSRKHHPPPFNIATADSQLAETHHDILCLRRTDSTTLQTLMRPSWPDTQLHGGSQPWQRLLTLCFHPLLLRHSRCCILDSINRE